MVMTVAIPWLVGQAVNAIEDHDKAAILPHVLAIGGAGDPAAARRADRRGRGEHLRSPDRQGVRARGTYAGALPPLGAAGVRSEHLLDAPAGLLLAAPRLPPQPGPRGGAPR